MEGILSVMEEAVVVIDVLVVQHGVQEFVGQKVLALVLVVESMTTFMVVVVNEGIVVNEGVVLLDTSQHATSAPSHVARIGRQIARRTCEVIGVGGRRRRRHGTRGRTRTWHWVLHVLMIIDTGRKASIIAHGTVVS